MIDETAAEIATLRTHSSSDVARKAARALEELLEREYATVEEFRRDLERNSDALRRASPSHASLTTTQRAIIAAVDAADPETVADAKAATADAIDDVVADLEAATGEAAANAAERLRDGDVLLTHDYSTTVLGAVRRAADRGASLTVHVTEARPLTLGRKMARTLADVESVDPTLIVDSAMGHVLADCDRVLVGMDCVVGETLYNRVGTYPIAATAADAGVPVTVAGASSKLVSSGFSFEPESRSASEVLREPPDGFRIENPSYDATPVRLLDEVVTEDGTVDL